jgi:general secretion pathway protein F
VAAYEYTALAANGRKTRGLTEADSERHARRVLREKGLTPLSVQATSDRSVVEKGMTAKTSRLRLGPTQVVLFTRLLGSLLESGLPLDDALSAIAKQSSDAALRRVVLDVRSRVLEGQSLADSVGQFPRAFPEVYRATVGAGEQTRLLPLVLQRVADYLERRQEVQQKIRLAMIYPAVLTAVSLLVVTGLLTFVVPEIVKVFEHSAQRLPGITLALLATSDFLKTHGVLLLAALVSAWLGLRALLRRPAARFRWDGMLLGLPVLGEFYRENDAGRFARTLGILLNSGLNMLDAFRISEKSVVNLVMRAELEAARGARARRRSAGHRAGARAPPAAAARASRGERRKLGRVAANARHRREFQRSRRAVAARDRTEPARAGADPDNGPGGVADRARDPAADFRDEPARLSVTFELRAAIPGFHCVAPGLPRGPSYPLVTTDVIPSVMKSLTHPT